MQKNKEKGIKSELPFFVWYLILRIKPMHRRGNLCPYLKSELILNLAILLTYHLNFPFFSTKRTVGIKYFRWFLTSPNSNSFLCMPNLTLIKHTLWLHSNVILHFICLWDSYVSMVSLLAFSSCAFVDAPSLQSPNFRAWRLRASSSSRGPNSVPELR